MIKLEGSNVYPDKDLNEFANDFIMASVFNPQLKRIIQAVHMRGYELAERVFTDELGQAHVDGIRVPDGHALCLLSQFEGEPWVEHTRGHFDKMEKIAVQMNNKARERALHERGVTVGE